MSIQVLIGEVQAAAEEFTSGNGKGHAHLLRAIQNLNLAVETPVQTLTRILYQVSLALTNGEMFHQLTE